MRTGLSIALLSLLSGGAVAQTGAGPESAPVMPAPASAPAAEREIDLEKVNALMKRVRKARAEGAGPVLTLPADLRKGADAGAAEPPPSGFFGHLTHEIRRLRSGR